MVTRSFATGASPPVTSQPTEGVVNMSTQLGPADLPGAPGSPVKLLVVLDTHPECSQALTGFGNSLLHSGVLDADEREFLINTVATLRPSDYIASGHAPIGLAVGLTASELEYARSGASAGDGGPSPRRRLLRRAAEELVETADLRPATLAALLDGRDPRELLEVLYVVGFYALIASITRVYGLEPESGTITSRSGS